MRVGEVDDQLDPGGTQRFARLLSMAGHGGDHADRDPVIGNRLGEGVAERMGISAIGEAEDPDEGHPRVGQEMRRSQRATGRGAAHDHERPLTSLEEGREPFASMLYVIPHTLSPGDTRPSQITPDDVGTATGELACDPLGRQDRLARQRRRPEGCEMAAQPVALMPERPIRRREPAQVRSRQVRTRPERDATPKALARHRGARSPCPGGDRG